MVTIQQSLLIVTVVLLFILLYKNEKTIIIKQETKEVTPNPTIVSVQNGGDSRYTMAPQPTRFWRAPSVDLRGALLPPDGGIAINVATQGLPESYQSMGVMKMSDGKMLPLFGRRVAARSDRFQYYTRTDTYNPVQIPIQYKKRDCQDQVGCDEVMDGESMSAAGESGTVSLYRFDGPTYIPGIV